MLTGQPKDSRFEDLVFIRHLNAGDQLLLLKKFTEGQKSEDWYTLLHFVIA